MKTFLKIFGFIFLTYSSVQSASLDDVDEKALAQKFAAVAVDQTEKPVNAYENHQNVLSIFLHETKESGSAHRPRVDGKFKAFQENE